MHHFRSLVVFTFVAMLLVNAPISAQEARDIEESRTYGKMFVKPIAVGSVPPVAVTEPIIESSAKRGYVAMQNPDRPSIVVYVKELSELDTRFYQSLKTIADFEEMPVFITLTLPKGVASENSPEQFNPDNYLTAKEMVDLKKQLQVKVDEMQLVGLDIGIAVNRFWRDSIGFEADHDVIIAYVRGKIQTIQQAKSGSIHATQLDTLIKTIGKLHREKAGQGQPK